MSTFDRTAAETIETLTDRLQTSTLLDDRRDACRGLRCHAKDYRVEVCAQALDSLLSAIKNDRQDVEIVNYCLEALNYIISGPLADSPAATWPVAEPNDPGRELAEIFLKKTDNVVTILDTFIENDFRIRWVSVRLLTGLARLQLNMFQTAILSFPLAISRLTELIGEEQEVLRNDALVLFVIITRTNIDIQKLVAFENCFDKIMYIIRLENYLDGTIAVVMDCLNILLNLIQCNETNQNLFCEGGYIQKLVPFFDKIHQIRWSNENTACFILLLQLIDSLVIPGNIAEINEPCQRIMQRCGLLDKLCELLSLSSMPIGVCYETMNAASDIIRGHIAECAHIVMDSSSMKPILLLSMMKEMRGP